ncbi:uncharacterized protein LOC124289066 [Haliotis rubra]|uniref:uncharacterized protein LOC124289066 n=1 Tax=Haliotis rubra TaxID=36100 RepID=UPI001EE5BA23|nr:uncharacterized protein LOC124289066 [Haliotis rubra]
MAISRTSDCCEEIKLWMTNNKLQLNAEKTEAILIGPSQRRCKSTASTTNLQKAYQDDDEIKRFVRRCAVLPLVPAQEVEDLWLDTLATMPDDDRCRQLGDYMTNFWVEGDLHMTQWNHHNSDGPRTNNHLEGWHSRLKKYVGKAHPNIFEIVSFLSREQTNTENKLVQYAAGQKRPSKKRKYRNLERRLDNICHQLEQGTLSVRQFADSASHLFV